VCLVPNENGKRAMRDHDRDKHHRDHVNDTEEVGCQSRGIMKQRIGQISQVLKIVILGMFQRY